VSRPFTLVAVLLLLLGQAAAAKAQAGEKSGRTTAVYAVAGLGTPVGFAGLEIVQRVGPVVELSAGIGSGLTAEMAHNGSSLQWAVMPRLRFGDEGQRNLTVGVGISGGNLADLCDDSCPPQSSYPVYYMLSANFEIGLERWWSNGFALRSFVGYAQGLLSAPPYSPFAFPYFGTGLGYAF
jgi:hypothetical protein